MKNLLLRTVAACALLAAFTLAANAQAKNTLAKKDAGSTVGSVMSGTGKVAVVIVGSAARSAWVTTKFVTKHAVWPVAKTALIKIPQKTAMIGLQTAGYSLKKVIPAAGKVGLAYLKAKMP